MTDDGQYMAETPVSAPVGTHPAIVTTVEPIELDTTYGAGQKLYEWTFVITDQKGRDYTETGLTGRVVSPRAKLTKWLAACLVEVTPGNPVDVRLAKGKAVLVVMADGDDGYVKLSDVVAAPR